MNGLSLRSLFGGDAEVLREGDFQLLLLATLLPVLGTSLLSPMLDSLIEPFGTSAANIGLMVSFFTAPAVVLIPVMGMLADRIGRKPVLIASLTLFGLSGSAIAFTTDFSTVLALRLLQGIGFSGINPVIITAIGDLYVGTKESTGQGLRFTGSGLSGTVFPLMSGLLVVISWRYPFLLYAMALPVAAAVAVWFNEPTDINHISSDGGETVSYRFELYRLVQRPRVLAMVMARPLPNLVWTGFLTYNSLIVIRVIGGTPPQAGILAAVGSLGFAAASSQAGRITSAFESRFWPLVGANGCLGAGFTVVLFAPGIEIATVGIAIVGIGFGITLSLYRSIITGLATDDLRAGLVSLAEAGGQMMNTLTPVAIGVIISIAIPVIGIGPAIQFAGLGAAIVGTTGGIFCLFVASKAPNVSNTRVNVAED